MTDSSPCSDGIGDALRRAALKFREKSALVFKERDWSFRELDRAVDRVASALLSCGLVFGDRVAAFGKNSDAYLFTMLACARAGLIHVPINDGLLFEEVAYIVNHCAPRAIFYDQDKHDIVQRLRSNVGFALIGGLCDGQPSILDIARSETQDLVDFPSMRRCDVAQIQYTSGTSGRPKGAVMSHGAMLSQYYSCLHELDYSEADVVLAALPLYHTAQMHAFTIPQLLSGSRTFLLSRADITEIGRAVVDHSVTSLFCPPTVWMGLLRLSRTNGIDLSGLRKCYYGAAIMPLTVLSDLRTVMSQAGFYNVYGQTEIAPVATVLRPEEHDLRPNSVGRPVLNVETRIVDDEMIEVASNENGEIIHKSTQLLNEYWGDQEETIAAFRGGWFHSGDLGYRDEDGYIYLVDRIKDVIKTGGVLVSAREVEEVLFSHSGVQEAAVIAIPDAKWIEAVCAIIVLQAGVSVSDRDVMQFCETKLAKFKCPKKVVFVDSLPKSAAGKILKRELRITFG